MKEFREESHALNYEYNESFCLNLSTSQTTFSELPHDASSLLSLQSGIPSQTLRKEIQFSLELHLNITIKSINDTTLLEFIKIVINIHDINRSCYKFMKISAIISLSTVAPQDKGECL